MKPIPLVRKVALAPAVSYLTRERVPFRDHFRRSGLSSPHLEDLESLVPLHQVCDFLSSVARCEGIADLGFRIAGPQGTGHLGTYGRFVAQSLTIHEAIHRSRELIASYNSGLQIWLERHGDQVRYCQKYTDGLPREQINEIVHLGLMSAMSQAYELIGGAWQVNRIELASHPVDLAEHFPALVNIPITFRQPFTSVWLNLSLMSARVRRFDASAVEVSDEDREFYFESTPRTDPMGQLEQAIESMLHHPRFSVGLTASAIGTSVRTLQRQLCEQGTSFSRVLEAVRFAKAQRCLRDPNMPLKEIARRLGYSDLPNFTRAFKRWTGVGPNEFRRLNYEAGRE